MLGKRPPPLMKKLSELLLMAGSGRTVATETSTSPRSPFDFKNLPPSPKYDLAGVGLGIVAALGHEAQTKHCISSRRTASVSGAGVKEDWVMEDETFTYVTRHGEGKSFTEVYYDAGEYGRVSGGEAIRDFHGSRGDSRQRSGGEEEEEEHGGALNFKTLDFLNDCNLCGKKLHGRDIYMYRGDQAFCSPECRSRQIVKEKCKVEASKSRTTSTDISSSPYNSEGSIFFSVRILAI